MESIIQISLPAARVNAGLTQEQAAKKIGVTRQTIINWEKGKIAPRVPEMYAIADVYNIPQENIFIPTNSTKSRV